MFSLLLRALLHRPNKQQLKQFKPPAVPSMQFEQEVMIDRANYQRYCDLTQWSDADNLHPCYLQMLALPMHMQCLANKRSPFPLLGLVHRENQIQQFFSPDFSLPLNFMVNFGQVTAHKRGWDVVMHSRVKQGGKLCYEATSTYLVRVKAPHVGSSNERPKSNVEAGSEATVAEGAVTLDAPADIGRRYARVSGDANPIHLYAVTARLFGFPKAIAHGMWTLATSVSHSYQPQVGDDVSVFCRFKTPLLLPGKAVIACQADGAQQHFTLADSRSGVPHLSGTVVVKHVTRADD